MIYGQTLVRRQLLARLTRYGVGVLSLPYIVPIERLFGQSSEPRQAVKKCSIEDKVKKITAEQLQVNEKEVALKSNFTEDLGADSLDEVELLMQFEEAFDIEISDEDASKLKTVGNVITYLNAHLSKAQVERLCSPEKSPIKINGQSIRTFRGGAAQNASTIDTNSVSDSGH